MTFSERYKGLSDDMLKFLRSVRVDALVMQGFTVGTSSKLIYYKGDVLSHMTTNTLKMIAKSSVNIDGGDLDKRLDGFLHDVFNLIESISQSKLVSLTGSSASTVSELVHTGYDGNYQISNLLEIADVAQEYVKELDSKGGEVDV